MRFTHQFLKKKKTKKISPHERSTCKIISRAEKKDGKDEISKLPFNSKTHSTLKKKTCEFICGRSLFFNYESWLEKVTNFTTIILLNKIHLSETL